MRIMKSVKHKTLVKSSYEMMEYEVKGYIKRKSLVESIEYVKWYFEKHIRLQLRAVIIVRIDIL